MSESDVDLVRLALETAREHGFAEVELESDGVKFRAKLEARPIARPSETPSIAPADEQVEEAGPAVADILAPCVGFFQQVKPALEPGREVAAGEIVASIQALGIANDVETGSPGEVVEVLVKDGDPVEYAQPLARVKVTA